MERRLHCARDDYRSAGLKTRVLNFIRLGTVIL